MRSPFDAAALLCVIAVAAQVSVTTVLAASNNGTNSCFLDKPLNLTLNTSIVSKKEPFLYKREQNPLRLRLENITRTCAVNDKGENCCGNPCQGNPCGYGKCDPGYEANFTCECDPTKFSGEYCEKCNRECAKGSSCNESGDCVCDPGYEGNLDGTTCTAYCKPDTFRISFLTECEDPDVKLTFLNFSKTGVDFTAYSKEKCEGRPYASIRCLQMPHDDVARFDEKTVTCVPCNKTLAKVLEGASSFEKRQDGTKVKENVTAEEIEGDFKILKVMTKDNLSEDDVKISMEMVNMLAEAVATRENLTITEHVLEDVLDILQNLDEQLDGRDVQNYSVDEIENIPNESEQDMEMRKSLQSVGQAIDDLARGVKLSSNMTVRSGRTTVEIIDMSTDPRKQQDFHIETKSYVQGDGNYEVLPNVTRVTINRASLAKMSKVGSSGDSWRLVLVLFQDASHLTVDKRTGLVLQGNYRRGENYTSEIPIVIKISFLLPPEPTETQQAALTGYRYKLHKQYFCVFWDYKNREWSDQGCHYTGPTTEKNISTCTCTHFTSFSLLLRTTVRLEDYERSLYNVIAISISTVCLFITAMIYVIVKDLRIRRPTPIMVNICVNLILGNLLFLFGMDGRMRNFSDIACYAAAVLMHVTYLSSWFWIFIYAINMYYALVKVIGRDTPVVGRKIFMYIVGYVCPIIIVGADLTVSLMLDKNNPHQMNDEDFLDTYISSHICWLHTYAMYLGFAAPIGVILFVNTILFFFVMRSISGRQIQSTREAATKTQQVFTAITMMTMMGLTWILGYIMLIVPDETYQRVLSYVFDVINTSQGTVIFLVSCVRQPSVRTLWLHPVAKALGCGNGGKRDPDGKQHLTDSSVATKSAGATIPTRVENEYTASSAL